MFTNARLVFGIVLLGSLAALICLLGTRQAPLMNGRGSVGVSGNNGFTVYGIDEGPDYFHRSLMAIYKVRYVPPTADGGHFHISQASEGRLPERRQTLASSKDPERTDPPVSVVSLLNGTAASDPNADLAPVQRQVGPDIIKMVGPVSQDRDLRHLPYVPALNEEAERPLRRFPPRAAGTTSLLSSDPELPYQPPSVPATMPTPSQSFDGVDRITGSCGCVPPDTNGDVGPSHYVQSVNSSFEVYSKTGTPLSGPTTFNSLFAPLGNSTPCGTLNRGDPVNFYDHIANRWVITDFAFTSFPGSSFYECIAVSKTSDPIAGGWWLYAVQIDPAHANYLGDYPKFGLWSDGYYMSVNMFSNNTTFTGVRVFALDRNSMINGTSGNVIAFTVLPADLGAQYSLLPATFRTGSPPPAGQPEWFMNIDSPNDGTQVLNSVYVRRFHADFAVPGNSTFGVGATHAPDAVITVNNFVDAFTNTGDTTIVPNGTADTAAYLDSLGDKLMYPLIYQNRAGVESIWATHTVNNNINGTGPTAIRWYQFNMTGNTIPATPTQQQTFDNGTDGLWRWMPSLNIDKNGNTAIGYSVSSTTIFPQIRYAGRLAGDAANTLAQGEATLIAGGGTQTQNTGTSAGRWGDYSATYVDPVTGCTFYHTNEYYPVSTATNWFTRVGAFAFPGCLTPTAATVTLSGRVLANHGAGVRNAVVTITDAKGNMRTAVTGAFGYYSFTDVEIGDYLVAVTSRRFDYSARMVSLSDSVTDLDFMPQQ